MAQVTQPPGAPPTAIRPAGYVLVVDTDGDRIARAVRACVDVVPMSLLVARDGDDAIRMLTEFGPPALLIAALLLPARDGLSVIDALRRIDESAAIIVSAADRELREYAACRLRGAYAKVLGPAASATVLRRCIDSMLRRHDEAAAAERGSDGDEENWSDLAERAQQALGVAGAAVYAKTGEEGYRLSVVWTSDVETPAIPDLLPAALEDIIAGGAARLWPDVADRPWLGPGSPLHESMRSLAIVPIRRNGETAGALCAFDSKPQALRESDVETMIAIAGGARPGTPVLRRASSPPIDRDAAQVLIPREVARVRREKLSLSVVLFAATTRPQHSTEPPSTGTPASVGDMLARIVRGNDLVVRWTDSEVLLVLTGVDNGLARRIAERVRAGVETNAANRFAVSSAVSELQTTDSFDATVARAQERLQVAVQTDRPRID